MQHKILFYILITLFLSCSNNTHAPFSKEKNLSGDVVRVYETTYLRKRNSKKPKIGDKASGISQYATFYDDLGRIKEFQALGKFNLIKRKRIFHYENNTLVKEEYFKGNGEKLEEVQLESQGGKVTSKKIFDASHKLILTSTFDYEGETKRVENIFSVDKGKQTTTVEAIFANNLLVKETFLDSKGQQLNCKVLSRDNSGNIKLVELQEKEKPSLTLPFEYEYDEKGNWIQKYEVSDKKFRSITQRVIVYQEDLEKKRTIASLTGAWYDVGANNWIDFKSKTGYQSGTEQYTKDYGKWEHSTGASTLTFTTEKPSKEKTVYNYEFKNLNLVLSSVNGKETRVLEKREKDIVPN